MQTMVIFFREDEIENGVLLSDPFPRQHAALNTTWIQRLSMDTLQSTYKAINTLWDREPAIITHSPFMLQQMSFDDLPQADADDCFQKTSIMSSDHANHRFMECDQTKNIPVSPYFIRETENQVLDMSIQDFVQCARSWVSRTLLLRATFLTPRSDSSSKEGTKCKDKLGETNAEDPYHYHCSSMGDFINHQWLHALCRSLQLGPPLHSHIYASTRGAFQPPKYCTHDQIVLQLCGRCRILLIPPEWSFSGMYPYPISHPYDTYSMVDIEHLDPGKWPGCSMVQGFSAILSPGDVLFVPSYWFADYQDLDKENVSLRTTIHHSSHRGLATNALSLRLSRVIEERVESVVGQSDVKLWLELVSKGKETDRINLGTVAGYHRAVMCQDIRDEIDQTLGQGTWSQFLSSMCRLRLTPTPWLNQHYKDPLLLKYQPVIVEDTRTEEERKYPTLFRRKLEAEGWNVTPTASTVPIPGVNMPMN